MRKLPLISIFCCLVMGWTFYGTPFVLADINQAIGQSSSDLDQKLHDVQTQINELEGKVAEAQANAQNLKQQIAYMDSQIKLTELRITQTENQIADLKKEIADLSVKIDSLDLTLDQMAQLLAARVSQTYKQGNLDTLSLFLGSDSFAALTARVRLLESAQIHDRELLLAMQKAKTNFEQEKKTKVQKQTELKTAQEKLLTQSKTLDQQKKGKQSLLTATKNDEKRYQELLGAARAEQVAMQAAISSLVANLKNGTAVKAGEAIAIMGNSGAAGGCSTAAHLHFEVTDKNGNHMNPAGYLKSDWPYTWDLAPDSPFSLTGNWDWPMKNPRITQAYGMTWWAKSGFYGGKPHTGIDMVDIDTTIRTPRAGTLYKRTASCRGKPMNYVAVEYDDVISWYWHVQ